MDGQDDHVSEEPHRLFVGAADELIDRFHQLLRAEDLGGVQAAVDPHDGLAVASELPCLFVGQALGEREPLGDVLVFLQVFVVLRRGDDGHQLIAALGGLADALQDHAVGIGVELAEELAELGVVRQDVVGADRMAEELLRRGDLDRGLGGGGRGREGERQQEKEDRGWTASAVHTVHGKSLGNTVGKEPLYRDWRAWGVANCQSGIRGLSPFMHETLLVSR